MHTAVELRHLASTNLRGDKEPVGTPVGFKRPKRYSAPQQVSSAKHRAKESRRGGPEDRKSL